MNCNCRLEKEIEALEKEEIKVSAKEEAILMKLKSVEKTTEDIIKVSTKFTQDIECTRHSSS